MKKRIWICLLALVCFAGYSGQQSAAAPERPTTLYDTAAMLAEGYGRVIDPLLVGKVPMYDDIQTKGTGTDMKMTDTVTITADFGKPVDPPLLKKIAMYNAGCIQPLTNYDRDFSRIRELNADSLRIDLSIGKDCGTGGQFLVGKDYERSAYGPNGEFEVDKTSLQYDFTKLDTVVDHMTDNGVLPYMSWSYIPYPLQKDGRWNRLNQKISNWQEVWEEIYYQYAKHYKDAGVQIGYHEIYNEPDLEILKLWGILDSSFDGFLYVDDFAPGGDPSKGVYPDMYEYGVKGILRADPEATIGGPGFALGEVGVADSSGFLPRVKEKGLPLDFYSFHSYMDGETWFAPEGKQNELEQVLDGLQTDPYFLKTAVHINEFSYLNDQTGSWDGRASSYNYHSGAVRTLDAVTELVDCPTVQWAHWAQFMESTAGEDPYGMIEHLDGNVKAPFNALKIYADMPVWRYAAEPEEDNTGLRTLVSATDDKIGILIWNTNSNEDKTVKVQLNNPGFAQGVRRIYRIDAHHASYFDDNDEAELEAQHIRQVNTDEPIWTGNVPAEGVVYITLHKDGEGQDFAAWEARTDFAQDIKTSYYYEDRYREMEGSYAHFDRTNWTMYLGMGPCDGAFPGQGHASGAVFCKGLPQEFNVTLTTEGDLSMQNENTTLGFRIDFYDEAAGAYTDSVYFHNGLYNEGRNPAGQDARLAGLAAYPWGTEKAAQTVVEMEGTVWNIHLADYAPAGWDAATGKAQLSFDMQNTGANTRAMFQLGR